MTNEIQDPGFEADLRAVLVDAAPADAPVALRDFVATVPMRAPARGWAARRRGFAVLAVAAAVVFSVAAIATSLRAPAVLPPVGGVLTPAPPSPGSLRLEYEVLPALDRQPGPEDIQAIVDVLRARLDATGVAGSTVSTLGNGSISVDVAVPADDASVADQIRVLLATTGRLDVVPLGGDSVEAGATLPPDRFPVLFSGDQVADATLGSNQTGQRTIDLTLSPGGASLFADYTRQHVGEFFAIVLDGTVITAPLISGEIPDGRVQISGAGEGGWPVEEAQRIVAILRSGALAFPIREVASGAGPSTPGPTITPAASLSPEGVACQEGSPDLLQPVVSISDGDRGALLLAGPIAVDPGSMRLAACRWARSAAGPQVTDSTVSILPVLEPRTILDRSCGDDRRRTDRAPPGRERGAYRGGREGHTLGWIRA